MTTLVAWKVEFTKSAVAQLERIIPKKFWKSTVKKVVLQLSTKPNEEAGNVKRLAPDRPPFFDGKDIWQLKLENYRFFYELLQDKVVVVFFIGDKGSKTTQDMVNDK